MLTSRKSLNKSISADVTDAADKVPLLYICVCRKVQETYKVYK
jgi:hypothetical protein